MKDNEINQSKTSIHPEHERYFVKSMWISVAIGTLILAVIFATLAWIG